MEDDQDLLKLLPDDLMCHVTRFLDALSLCRLEICNTRLQRIMTLPEAGWTLQCRQLWSDKVHVCPSARALLSNPDLKHSAKQAYRQSTIDAKHRNHIHITELCYDPETQLGTVWRFRFKESAGQDWTMTDPWYRGEPCRRMVLLRNGMVRQYCDKAPLNHSPDFGQAHLVDPPRPMTWRFLTRPMDLPERPAGSYLRFTVAGRDIPTYSVRRSPTHNWGFVMESCWGLYASFELPPRVDDKNPLADAHLIITNERQWREAFLYNVGARTLPEGDEATVEFDRAWGG